MAPPKKPKVDAPPDTPWEVRPASARAHREWVAAVEREPDLMDEERRRLRERPLDRSRNPRRTGPLAGPLATQRVGDKVLPQWQHEITGAGQVWYCPDQDERVVWVMKVALLHP